MKWVTVLWCFLVCGLLQAQDNFPDVPEGHQDHIFLARLRAFGLLRHEPERVKGRYPTPQEYARAAVATIEALPTSITEYKASPATSTKNQLIEEFSFLYLGIETGLTRWLTQYGEEIRGLGYAQEDLRKRLKESSYRLQDLARSIWETKRIVLADLLLPDRHPLFKTLAWWRANGLPMSTNISGHRLPYRIEIAQHVVDLVNEVPSAVRAASEFIGTTIADPKASSDYDIPEDMERLQRDIHAVIAEFKNEFTFLGESDRSLLDKFAATKPARDNLITWHNTVIGKRFADVPRNHWASEAVEKMRRLGLLKGYPDGKFRG